MKYRIYENSIISEPSLGSPHPNGDYYIADLHEAIVVSAERGYRRWFDDFALRFSQAAVAARIKFDDWRLPHEPGEEGRVRAFAPELLTTLAPRVYASREATDSDFAVEIYTRPARSSDELGVIVDGQRMRAVVEEYYCYEEETIPGYIAESKCVIRVYSRNGERIHEFLPGEVWAGAWTSPCRYAKHYFHRDTLAVGDLAPIIIEGKVDSLCRW